MACTPAVGPAAPSRPVSADVILAPPTGVMVEVAVARHVDVSTRSKVFVYLRESGTRMPFAVAQLEPADLPTTVGFTTQRSHGSVTATARLSVSGRIEKQPGDLEVSSDPLAIGHPAAKVRLILGEDRARGLRQTAGTHPTHAPRSSPGIEITVDADPSVDVPPEAEVYVILRAPDDAIPIAVKKVRFRELPATILLTDDDRTWASRTLGSVDRYVVVARVDGPYGKAEFAADSWFGKSPAFDRRAYDGPIGVVIDTRSP